jgi:hypothetical protein
VGDESRNIRVTETELDFWLSLSDSQQDSLLTHLGDGLGEVLEAWSR